MCSILRFRGNANFNFDRVDCKIPGYTRKRVEEAVLQLLKILFFTLNLRGLFTVLGLLFVRVISIRWDPMQGLDFQNGQHRSKR